MNKKLLINGKSYEIEADDDMPLLWAIRDIVGLKGTKFGCGKGLCGSCTVTLDGAAIRSCSTPLSVVGEGQAIMTIEGLSEDGNHPLQKAWKKHQVPQCGYCQAGQIMNAAALLSQNKKPNSDEIDAAQSGNICRCGTYQRIRAAIEDAAEMMEEA